MRISFANFVFFALHAVVLFKTTKTEGDPRVHLHTGFWSAKLLLWVGALIGEGYGNWFDKVQIPQHVAASHKSLLSTNELELLFPADFIAERKEKLRRQRKLSLHQLRKRRHIGSKEP
eukprot:1152502-Pelagomonas_calceolata.AAC.1